MISDNQKKWFFALILFYSLTAFSQTEIKGVIADSISRQALPFATIRTDNQTNTFFSGISGKFVMVIPASTRQVLISYVSYRTRTLPVSSLKNNDTIFLSPLASTLGEVIIRPQPDKIRRIINEAVKNRSLHNPELYDLYHCNIYYKMRVDIIPSRRVVRDSTKLRKPTEPSPADLMKLKSLDSINKARAGRSIVSDNNHLLFSETYSKRFYERPQQLQEIIIASRFSGLKKTYFANLGTEVLPFHVNSDYISMGSNDYINPIAKGWQQRYDFFIADEIIDGQDTTFILAFNPKKNTGFKSLKGLVYIHTDGYAISHFISSTTDTTSNREIRLDQVYSRVNGKWFPSELNYDLIYGSNSTQLFSTHMNGHSIVDSVSFTRTKDFKFNRAYSIKIHDSVDLRSPEDWQSLRRESLTSKEENTYHLIDSISREKKLEKMITAGGKLGLGRLPVGIFDIDVLRLLSVNNYEGARLGLGLFTNDKLSKYYSVGGWTGYGFRTRILKYGLSATLFPGGNKDNWLRFSYNDDYQNAGNVRLHTEIDRTGFRNWLLARVDNIKEFSLTAHAQKGYLQIEVNGTKQKLASLYDNNFVFSGKNYTTFNVEEASIGLRYAYGEKRMPLFGYYFPVSTKHPIVYFRSGFGSIHSGDYSAKYVRALAAITYSKRSNRWGKDAFRLEAGIIHVFDDMPISRSFLLAAKGFRRTGTNYYAWGGFLTMRSYDYYSNSFVSLLYKHDFDKYLWRTKFSMPFVSVAHNAMYGGLVKENRMANAGIASALSGYHESGILFNQLIQVNLFSVSYIYFNAGAFYHWKSPFDWQKNGVWVIGVSAGF